MDNAKPMDRIESTLPIDDPIFLEIANDFVALLSIIMEELRVAAESDDREQLTRLAHNLRGTAGSAGFDEFTNPARDLETLSESGPLEEVFETLCQLEKLAARVYVPAASCDDFRS